MVNPKVIQKQLKDINFGGSPWNQAELRELPKIIHEGEVISECVNGMYEGGVALLVATEMRLLLIDKKPLRFLTVEDLRFDMINEIDFSHRLMNATINVSTGSKNLKFKSYNQSRLRHLINLVQEHMTNGKKEQSEKADNQQQHLQEINKQLQMYLMAQHQQLQQQLQQNTESQPAELPKPDPKLSDYLFAQRLLEEFKDKNGELPAEPAPAAAPTDQSAEPQPVISQAELAEAARKEIFSKQVSQPSAKPAAKPNHDDPSKFFNGIEVNPVKVAYSKLPMMLRNRKFGRPSLHAHSQETSLPTGRPATSTL